MTARNAANDDCTDHNILSEEDDVGPRNFGLTLGPQEPPRAKRPNPEKDRAWRIENRERLTAKRAAWRKDNPAREKTNVRAWREKNRDLLNERKRQRLKTLYADPDWRAKYKAQQKAWRDANKHKRRQPSDEEKQKRGEYIRSYYAANKDRLKSKVKEYREAHKDDVRAWSVGRKARKRDAAGRFTADNIRTIRALQRDKCAYCRKALKGKGHIDHIKPLARGGTNDPRNLQLTCEPCNLRKKAKDAIKFAQEIGLLL